MKKKRNFWRWLILWARAGAMSEARKKRIMRENLEAWNRNHRDFINKCDRDDDSKREKEWNRTSYLGFDPMDGSGWKYCDDD